MYKKYSLYSVKSLFSEKLSMFEGEYTIRNKVSFFLTGMLLLIYPNYHSAYFANRLNQNLNLFLLMSKKKLLAFYIGVLGQFISRFKFYNQTIRTKSIFWKKRWRNTYAQNPPERQVRIVVLRVLNLCKTCSDPRKWD